MINAAVLPPDAAVLMHPYYFFDQSNVGDVLFEYRGRRTRVPYLGALTDDIQRQLDERYEEWKAEVDFEVSCDCPKPRW